MLRVFIFFLSFPSFCGPQAEAVKKYQEGLKQIELALLLSAPNTQTERAKLLANRDAVKNRVQILTDQVIHLLSCLLLGAQARSPFPHADQG